MTTLQRKNDARIAGALYLGLALAGLAGFLLVRQQLFVSGDAAATAANLAAHPALARAGVAFELLVVLTQALVAGWFYRLFRDADPVGAAGIAAFGLMNAGAILVSAALLATTLQTGAAAEIQLLYLISGNLWEAGGLFFGLWLIPMGTCVLRTGGMPRALGWILVAGGAGYVLSTFIPYALAADLLVVPATIGEFWMIGYLLIKGTPQRAAAHA